MNNLGRRVYGFGAIALGLIGLAFADFALVWQPVPPDVPHRTLLAYATAAALVLAGAASNTKRLAALGCGTLAVLYGLCVLLLHGPRVVAHPLSFQPWAGVAEQLALASGGALAFAGAARLGASFAARLSRVARTAFAICLVVFGLVHFVYPGATAAFAPPWLPPSRLFWAYATGTAHIVAGLAILAGVQARLAAILVTAMFVVFGALVHAPLLLSGQFTHLSWASNAMNLALIGAAWVVADSLGRGNRKW
jgi:uncharacterized membrane protein YphA (DoxX/SURF4 family)